VGLFGLLFAAPWVGLAGAAGALVMLRVPHGRLVVRAVAAGLAVVVMVGIPVSQLVNRFPPYFDWPGFFDWARLPTWLLLVLLLADVAVDIAGGTRRTAPAPDAPSGGAVAG
jgi:purine-cytosine permease-like protein